MDKITAQSWKNLPLRHFFTTRNDGVSQSPYNFNNLGLHVKDKKEDVYRNREALLAEIGAKHLVSMNQIHSNKITIIDDDNYNIVYDCDGIITNKKDIALMVMVADCTPVLLYDAKKHVIAALHVGRSGAFNNIITKAIREMSTNFGSKVKDLHVSFGPSIHSCCYEINEAIAKECSDLGYAFAISYRAKKPYLDVNGIIVYQLLTCKLTEEQIEDVNHCTSCENSRFFSYRADNQKTGRMCGVITL